MKITIITVGKAHDKDLAASINQYEQRLRTYTSPIEWVVVPSGDKNTESLQIIKHLQGTVVLLDESGELINSPALADKIEHWQNSSVKHLTFIIGGAFGVNDEVKSKADFTWSLSPLVFPHQLVRLILCEQLYRAYDILAGGKYHHS